MDSDATRWDNPTPAKTGEMWGTIMGGMARMKWGPPALGEDDKHIGTVDADGVPWPRSRSCIA